MVLIIGVPGLGRDTAPAGAVLLDDVTPADPVACEPHGR
jgi:hypothetical protein